MSFFYVFITSMLVCLLLTPILISWANTLNLVDIPDERKVHIGSIPRVGGLAMVIGTLLSILLWVDYEVSIYSYLAGVIIIAVFGTWDDKVQLGYKAKFIGQVIAALVVIFFGNVKIISLPFLYDGYIPDVISIPFTLFALLGITNAVNLSDGLDGLAGGSSLFSLGIIALLGFVAGDINFVLLCLAVIGAILGFLRFNTHPAIIFMGDTGSQFLGFSLGVLVIWLTQQSFTVLSPAVAIIILGLPILDTIYVMTQRILDGKSPFKPDKRHLHHQLLSAGLDHYEAVFFIYLIQSSLVICAYFFRFNNDFSIILAYFISGFFIIISVEYFNKTELLKKNKRRFSIVRKILQRGTKRNQLVRFCAATAVILMLLFFYAIVFSVDVIPVDILIISTLLLFLNIAVLFLKKRIEFILHFRLQLYITCTIVVYLFNINSSMFHEQMNPINALFLLFLVIIFIGMALPEKKENHITPLDYIIIFILVIFFILPDRFVDITMYSADIGRLFVLFYLSEFILMSVKKNLPLLKAGALSVPGLILLKSLF